MKEKCIKCGGLATWIYMPSDSNRSYCDVCVPRGCSCNLECDEDGNFIFDKSGELVQYLDDQGRELPCCEYDFFEEGIDE